MAGTVVNMSFGLVGEFVSEEKKIIQSAQGAGYTAVRNQKSIRVKKTMVASFLNTVFNSMLPPRCTVGGR